MSRLESNAEPSMEEILASIRKIIAEDSSGMRTPTPPRPGASYSPASRSTTPLPSSSPAPQRGFMTREAFLKSSQPEPEPRQAHTPANAPRALGGDFDAPSPAARSAASDIFRTHEEVRAKDSASPKAQSQQTTAKEDATPLKRETARRGDEIETSVTETVETVEVVALQEALPTIEEDVVALREAGAKSAEKPGLESDTARIEAQLAELLSEDLSALRQRSAEGESASESEVRTDKAIEAKSASEANDPFAFDLGPSPFAAKSEPPRPVAAAPAPEPAPAPAAPSLQQQAPAAAFEPPRTTSAPSFTEINAASGVPFGNPSAPAEAGVPSPTLAPPVANAQPESPASKSRQTFAIPSVSATIGPFRKLEPLSNAFGPAPTPPPSAIETFSPVAEPAFDHPRIPEPSPQLESHRVAGPAVPPPPSTGRAPVGEPAVHSGLPATTSESALDRPMEDAVADLLRPLLKTWLAENMPKIVERALRREMSERLLPGQKNPLD